MAQTAVVALIMLTMVVAPPASGSMLLLPLASAKGGAALQIALDHGARLEGAGPFAGSFVIRAERDQIAGSMLKAGVIMLAATPMLCGGSQEIAR
jgi:hypothetical protein